MYCSLNGQVKSSILLGQRRRPVCLMLKVDILGRQDHRESLSTVDGALRCCGSAGTVQTSMVVPGRVDTCWPWCRVWTWHAQGRPANVGRYDECLSAHGRTCGCQIRLAPPHWLCAVACPMNNDDSNKHDDVWTSPRLLGWAKTHKRTNGWTGKHPEMCDQGEMILLQVLANINIVSLRAYNPDCFLTQTYMAIFYITSSKL